MLDLQTLVDSIVKTRQGVDAETALALASHPDAHALFAAADDLRRRVCGDSFSACSIINARSGLCPENCKWCAQSCHHKAEVERYEFVPEADAVAMAERNAKLGVHRFSLVTSGRALTDEQVDKAVHIYRAIRERCDIHLCASMGLLNEAQLQKLWDVGVRHYHCNIETAPSFFPQLCSTHTFEDKRRTILAAKKIGFTICSGGIIGMGETMAQRIEMAITVRDLGAESIPVNVLVPIAGTPLANQPALEPEDILRTFAVFRFIHPTAEIRMAGGRIRFRDYIETALHAGANGSIVGDMLTTAGPAGILADLDSFRRNGFSL